MRWKSLIGEKSFYKKALLVAVPIMIQNGITNFVGMLDNIMVGRVGTDAMSGVSIVNTLLFVFNLCIFGGLSGIGIFTSQFYGKGDEDGVRYSFRLQVLAALVLTAVGTAVLVLTGGTLVGLYLRGESGSGDPAATAAHAAAYLRVMLVGLLPFAMTQVYSSTLRSTGETVVPMNAGIAAVLINLAGNYVLIYGKFGAPALGAVGAAAATVISRFAELLIVAVWTHRHKAKCPFIVGAYPNLTDIPAALTGQMLLRAFPLMLNEVLWSAGMAVMNQNYSMRGLDVVAAMNISSTISNVFNISFIAMGSAIAIILGQELGAGETDRVRRDAERLALFTMLLCVISGALLFSAAGIFPEIYNTGDEVRALAADLIRISGLCMVIYGYENSAYFTLRSGGKTLMTMLFDSCFVWVVSIPAAFFMVRFTQVPIRAMYLIIQLLELIKCAIGFIMVRKGVWIQNITSYRKEAA